MQHLTTDPSFQLPAAVWLADHRSGTGCERQRAALHGQAVATRPGRVAGHCRCSRRSVSCCYRPLALPRTRAHSAAACAQQGRYRVDADIHGVRAADVRSWTRTFLWRPGTYQEHALGADAGIRRLFADQRACGACTATRWLSRPVTPFRRTRRLFLKGTFDWPQASRLAPPSARERRCTSWCSSRSRRPLPRSPAA